MAKAKRLLGDKLKLINVAVIVVDARAPLSTFNPDLFEMLSGKECIVVLNKADLADNAATRLWTEYYSKSHIALPFSAISSKKDILLAAINRAAAPVVKRYADKGMRKTVRVLVCGIPNTGKSALLPNQFVGYVIQRDIGYGYYHTAFQRTDVLTLSTSSGEKCQLPGLGLHLKCGEKILVTLQPP